MPSFETGLSGGMSWWCSRRRRCAGQRLVCSGICSGVGFGAPLVELHVPAGILTVEQRGAMIKGITEAIVEGIGTAARPAKRPFVEI